MSDQMIDVVIVFFVGALVGMGELIARYRDNPTRALRTLPAVTYVTINGLASLLALMAILTFGWIADAEATAQAQRLTRILAAGFGAMALLRTSLFVVRVGTTDVGIGPVAFLQILLAATDRGVDRKRASDRAETVVRIMDKLDFSIAFNSLPPFAMMLMQNLTLEDQTAIAAQVKGLVQPDSKVPNQTRVLNLGLMLMNYVGEEVLEDAVRGVQGQQQPGRSWGLGRSRDHGPDGADSSSSAGGTAPATGGGSVPTTGGTAPGSGGGSAAATSGSAPTTSGGPASAAGGSVPATGGGSVPATGGGSAPATSRRRGAAGRGAAAGAAGPAEGADPPPGTTAVGTPLPREEDAPKPDG